eukprot:scaffold10327_cov122-Isochrysis_galbana.AAC.5
MLVHDSRETTEAARGARECEKGDASPRPSPGKGGIGMRRRLRHRLRLPKRAQPRMYMLAGTEGWRKHGARRAHEPAPRYGPRAPASHPPPRPRSERESA